MTKRRMMNQQGGSTAKNKSQLNRPDKKISKKKSMTDAKVSSAAKKNDWEDAVCPVCMECPHEAVLLLCTSHTKGCHPYLCDTSYEFSNCLNRFKEACSNTADLSCPLCRGKVTGWTVVKPAREFLNGKKRSCSQDNCSFTGKFEDLKKHMKLIHPLAKAKEADLKLEKEWKRMEEERERNDLMITIRATTPGSMVVGDYVIENPTPSIPGQISNLIDSIRSMMDDIPMVPGTSLNPGQLQQELMEIHSSLRQAVGVNPEADASTTDESLSFEHAPFLARVDGLMSRIRSARREILGLRTQD